MNKIRHHAYLTGEEIGAARVKIEDDRVVIRLGRDEGGRPLELSVDLIVRENETASVCLYSINEEQPFGANHPYWPRIVVRPTNQENVLYISVVHDNIEESVRRSTG